MKALGLAALAWLVPIGVWATPADPLAPGSRPPLSSGLPEEPPPPKDRLYDGNHVGWMVGGVLSRLDRQLPGLDRWGQGARLSGRIAAVTQVVDAGVDLQQVVFAGPSAALARSELAVTIGTHPALPILVFNDWKYDVIAGLHGYVGAAVSRAELSGVQALAAAHQAGAQLVDWRPLAILGFGADLPVSPRHRPHGWWLTLRYELRWSRFGHEAPEHPLGDQLLVLALGYRHYSNGWARIPRPF